MAAGVSTEILRTTDHARWLEALDAIGSYDFCHLPAYSRLAESSGQGSARFYLYREGDYLLAFPLLLRDIPEILGSGLLDATSVYGYAGPLANAEHIPAEVRRRFTSWVAACLQQEGAVSAFSRLHPLMRQAPLLEGCGCVLPAGWTLSMDLTLPEEQQVASYRRNHRQDIKHLRTMGVVSEIVGPERVADFTSIYHENMHRVGASSEYYFDQGYFQHMLTDMPDVTHLHMCFYEGRPIAGGIFTLCHGICQWYLSGSSADFDGPPPAKLMFDEARRWARAKGAHILHLGGGVGGQRNSLYHFKRGFTQCEHVYSVWELVLDHPRYDQLVARASSLSGPLPEEDYFPRYRHSGLKQ